jgi:hypothetical protein
MAHKFRSTDHDPYVVAAQALEEHVFTGPAGDNAGAGEELYGRLGDAIVAALGDIGAEAFRLGVNQPEQVRRLADAVAATAGAVLTGYVGEVDAEPILAAIANDPRRETLGDTNQEQLDREIEKTRRLEGLLLDARRLPALIDFAGSLGLVIHEDVLDSAPLIVPGETPTGPGATQLPPPDPASLHDRR